MREKSKRKELCRELALRVREGSISEEDILQAIKEIKISTRPMFGYDKTAECLSDAYLVWTSDYISEELSYIQSNLDPQKLLIKKDLWEKLSDQAKTVIELITKSSPKDWRRGKYGQFLFSRCQNTISRSRLEAVLSKQLRWTPKEIKKAMKEVKDFTHNICCEETAW